MNVKVLLIVVSGLLVAVLVAVIVVANILIRQEEQRVYEACMGRAGFAFDELAEYDNSDDYIDALAAAAERCSD